MSRPPHNSRGFTLIELLIAAALAALLLAAMGGLVANVIETESVSLPGTSRAS